MAFSTPSKFSYANMTVFPEANDAGLYGITLPSFHVAAELLFSPIGLLILMPVVALGAVGTFFLYRCGHRAEALLITVVALANFLLIAAKHYAPLRGDTPGPRYLMPMLPFLALGLGTAYRRLPVTTVAPAAASTVQMVVLTVTHPTEATWGGWFHRLASLDLSRTVFDFVGAQPIGLVLFLRQSCLPFCWRRSQPNAP